MWHKHLHLLSSLNSLPSHEGQYIKLQLRANGQIHINTSFAGLPTGFMLPPVLIYYIACFSKVNQLKAGYSILLEGT